MLNPVRTVAPTDTPVSLTEVKAHCRVDGTDSDAVLTMLLAGAVSEIEKKLQLVMVTQTWRQDFCGFDSPVRLAKWPVASITSVTYYDADNVSQTLATSVYILRSDELGSYLDLKVDQDWPSSYSRDDAVSVTYVAGTAVSDVPAELKDAILLRIQASYDPPSPVTSILLKVAEVKESLSRRFL